jgi:hypothetical protein
MPLQAIGRIHLLLESTRATHRVDLACTEKIETELELPGSFPGTAGETTVAPALARMAAVPGPPP